MMSTPTVQSNHFDDGVVEMRGIVKRFPGVLANDHVDFELRRGEIHALLGENGAGKSTLMNILAGLYRQDSGLIKVNGKLVEFSSPKDAIDAGIGMVHQHFMLVPSQTVTENILLGLNKPRFIINLNEYDQIISDLGKRFGMLVDPGAKIWQLSVGEQQRVEILKMLYRGAQVLIMDEPTAVLAPQEINDLFATLRTMTLEGKSIIFISHKLNEVTEIADRVSVMRKGKMTASNLEINNVTRQELARQMVGRDVIFHLDKKPQTAGNEVLRVEDLFANNDKGLPALKGVSLQVHTGEIVGLAGVAGNGQGELVQVLSGLRKCTQGRALVTGKIISNKQPLHNIKLGVSHIPEDRTHVGSAPNLSITDNVIMKKYRQAPLARGVRLDMNAANDYAQKLKEAYDIIAPSLKTPVRLLSGGNLQRVILAREISTEHTLMIAMQPTRGLDVGAIEGVHRLLLAQREAGAAILLVSEELEELLALSDRLYVIYEGQIMGELKVEPGLDEHKMIETIGLMMTGTPLEIILRQGESLDG